GTGVYTVHVDNFQVVEVVPSLNSSEATGLVELNVKAGSTLTFTASATDTDPVTFAFESGAPTGASLNASTGAFVWTPSAGQAGTTANIGIYVEDNPTNGGIKKRDADEFVVNVIADPVGPQNVSEDGAVSAGETATLTWDSTPGTTYKVQSKGADGVWVDEQIIVAEGSTTFVDVGSSEDRVYRVVEISGGGSDE
ncbi:MAG: putative Ig domain-containing protein, partial [Limisphaerales bacterium]